MIITNKLKLLLLILLSLLSVFFAEVISGSMRYPLFDLWGYGVVIPLYGLHTILLLTIIRTSVKNKKIRFSTLYFGGVLFGLYEAYITKVLFVGLSEDSFMLLNIPIVDYIVLVFFWHPLFSFIIPVLVFEKIIAKTDYVYQGLPKIWKKVLDKKFGIVLLMSIVGLFSAFNGMFDSLTLSELSLALPILIIIFILYKKGITNQYTLDEILPNKKGIILSIIYLSGLYIVLGAFVKPEVLHLENQIPIWISYIVFGCVFYFKLRKNKQVEETEYMGSVVPYRTIIYYTAVIMISGVIFIVLFWLLGIKDIIVITIWIIWNVVGLYLLIVNLFK